MYIYNFVISLIVTEIRERVGIRRRSVIGDFPLLIFIWLIFLNTISTCLLILKVYIYIMNTYIHANTHTHTYIYIFSEQYI